MLVVQQQHLDGQLLREAAGQLLDVHQEAAVAVDVDDRLERVRRLGAQGGRQAEAHRPQAATGQHLARTIEAVVQGHEHLVLADVVHQRCCSAEHAPQRADDFGRRGRLVRRRRARVDHAAPCVVVCPLLQTRPPVGPCAPLGESGQAGQCRAGIRQDRHVGSHDAAE